MKCDKTYLKCFIMMSHDMYICFFVMPVTHVRFFWTFGPKKWKKWPKNSDF